MTNSILLSIGIDEYQDRTIDKLSYCVADCFRAERIFNVFNIVNSFITLTNQEATGEKILETLTYCASNFNNVYVIYSSHGASLAEQSYLYSYDTNQNNIKDTGIPLNYLISKLQYINKVTLIIDACGMINPVQIPDNLRIFCPAFLVSYEDSALRQSIFIKEVLSILSKENFGNFACDKNKRYQRIRQELSLLIMKKNILLLKGQSGLGKSHLLRMIKKEENHSIYVSLPKVKGLSFDIVLSLISEALVLSDSNAGQIIDADPERYIQFYSNMHPYCLLLIDHIEHLSDAVIGELLNFLNDLPLQKIITSRAYNNLTNHKNFTYDFPPLTKEDIVELIKDMGLENHYLLNQDNIFTFDNYIELLKYIDDFHIILSSYTGEDLNPIKKACNALIVSGGYINEDLFIKTFELQKEAIKKLKQIGLIIFDTNFFYPHDSIYFDYSKVEINKLLTKACLYWQYEIQENPTTKAIQSFILIINTFAINVVNIPFEIYKIMIHAMQGRQNTHFLLLLNEYLKDKNIPLDLRVYLCESLINIGRFEEAKETFEHYRVIPLELKVLSVELLWWQGKFADCIVSATQLLSKFKKSNAELPILCSRGIGYFFIGKWEKSSKDLEKVIHDQNNCDEKIKYLAYCVLATIQGLRGTNFASSVDNFIQALIYAKKSGKLSWIALIYGNIGEILWKAGFYEQSHEILKTASHMAYLTDNSPLYLEINRNLLHLYHRSNRAEKNQQLEKLEGLFSEQSDNYVKMQIVNTLVTHYIFNNDNQYKKYIDYARTLTQDNAEYHIYTLANIAIAKLFENNLDLAKIHIEKALALCLIGKNWLAIKQCLEDWDHTIHSHHLDSALLSKKLFQKWHQILERELVPYLHHLSRLCEYLQYP